MLKFCQNLEAEFCQDWEAEFCQDFEAVDSFNSWKPAVDSFNSWKPALGPLERGKGQGGHGVKKVIWSFFSPF